MRPNPNPDPKGIKTLAVASEAAARGKPIEPDSIRAGTRVFPDKDGERGTLSAGEARRLRTQFADMATTPKGRAAAARRATDSARTTANARPRSKAQASVRATRQQARNRARAPTEPFAHENPDRRALGEGDYTVEPRDAVRILGPRRYRGAGTGETLKPPTGTDFSAPQRRMQKLRAQAKKLVERVAAVKGRPQTAANAKALADLRTQYADLATQYNKALAAHNVEVKNATSTSRMERGAAPNLLDTSLDRDAEIALVQKAADRLGMLEKGGRVLESAEGLAALYADVKRRPESAARRALMGAIRRLADEPGSPEATRVVRAPRHIDERGGVVVPSRAEHFEPKATLAERLNAIDNVRPSKIDTVQHDADLAGGVVPSHYSRTSTAGRGMSVDDVEKAVRGDPLFGDAGLLAKRGLRVKVIPDKSAFGARADEFGDAKGGFIFPRDGSRGGTVVLAASRLHDVRDVRATLRHEMVAHYGLNLFEPSTKRAILEKVGATRGDARARALGRGDRCRALFALRSRRLFLPARFAPDLQQPRGVVVVPLHDPQFVVRWLRRGL